MIIKVFSSAILLSVNPSSFMSLSPHFLIISFYWRHSLSYQHCFRDKTLKSSSNIEPDVAKEEELYSLFVHKYFWLFSLSDFLFHFQSVLLQQSAHGGVGGGVGGSYPPTDSWNPHRPEHTAPWSPNMEVCTHKCIWHRTFTSQTWICVTSQPLTEPTVVTVCWIFASYQTQKTHSG